jgi:hypothetical protein
MLPSGESESESLECRMRCFPKVAFLSRVPNPDISSASRPEGVRLGLSNSLLGLTSLSSSLSEIADDFLRCEGDEVLFWIKRKSDRTVPFREDQLEEYLTCSDHA